MTRAPVPEITGANRTMPTFRARRTTTGTSFAATFESARRTGLAAAEAGRIPRPSSAAPSRAESLRADIVGTARGTPVNGAQAGPYADLINQAATRHGIDTTLLAAVTRAESGFDPRAVSRAGAKGLMQLMDPTAKMLGVQDSFDPAQNIEGGTRFLSEMLKRFQKPELALAAYNAGPGAVTKHGGIPPFKETQTYVQRVLDYQKQMRQVSV